MKDWLKSRKNFSYRYGYEESKEESPFVIENIPRVSVFIHDDLQPWTREVYIYENSHVLTISGI